MGSKKEAMKKMKSSIKKPNGSRGKLSPGLTAFREIKFYQVTTDLLIPKLAFQRLVRAIVEALHVEEGRDPVDLKIKFESQALLALQEATEAYLTGYMEDAQLVTVHTKRVTLMNRDLDLVKTIRE